MTGRPPPGRGGRCAGGGAARISFWICDIKGDLMEECEHSRRFTGHLRSQNVEGAVCVDDRMGREINGW